MPEVRPSDIIFRAGGRVLEKYGVPAIAGGGRPRTGDLIETFSRADGGVQVGFYDQAGLLRFAGLNVLRAQWMDTDGDAIRDRLALWFDDARTSRALGNNDFNAATGWFQVGTPVFTANYVSLGAISMTKIADDDGAATEYTGFNYNGKTDKPWASPTDGDGTKPVSIFWTKSDLESPSGAQINITDTTAAGAVRFSANIKADGAGAPVISSLTGTYLGAEFITTVGTRKVYRLHFLTGTVTVANEHVIRVVPSGGGPASETGDIICALYQVENAGAFPSSPITPTTTVAIVKAADDLLYTLLGFSPSNDFTALARVVRTFWMDSSVGPAPIAPGISAIGSALPSLNFFFAQAVPGAVAVQIRDGATIQGPAASNLAAGTIVSVVGQWWNLKAGGFCKQDGGSGFSADSTPAANPFSKFGNADVYVGRRIGASQYLNGGLLDLIWARGRFSLVEMLKAAT